MKPLSLAIVGCGDLTQRTILPHLAEQDARAKIRVEAVCDLNAKVALQTARDWQIPAFFGDFESLLRGCDAEAIAVVVPPALHARYAIQALKSGRHVYVQKPLASSVEAARSVVLAARNAGKSVVAAPGQGLWPLHQTLRTLIEAGAIGSPYVASGGLIGWGGREVHHGSDPSWCFSSGSGPLRDHGVYTLATLTHLLGPVSRVQAMGQIRAPSRIWRGKAIEVSEFDNLALTLEFACGALGILAESWCSSNDNATAYRINGLEGSLEGGSDFVGYHGIFPMHATLHRNGHEPQIYRVDPNDVPFLAGAHRHLPNPHIYADLCHLAAVARGETANLCGEKRAMHIVQILEMAHQTASSNKSGTLINSL